MRSSDGNVRANSRQMIGGFRRRHASVFDQIRRYDSRAASPTRFAMDVHGFAADGSRGEGKMVRVKKRYVQIAVLSNDMNLLGILYSAPDTAILPIQPPLLESFRFANEFDAGSGLLHRRRRN